VTTSGDPGDPADPRDPGDVRGAIEGDEGGESPCLAHLVDDPPALPDDRLAQLVTRLTEAAARAGGEGSAEPETAQRPASP
jgi:hypothetical protein